MRSPCSTMLAGLAVLGLAAVASGQPASGVGGFTELQRTVVSDADDLEVVMGLIVRSGQGTSSKHYHPGGEFGFVIEGSASVTSEVGPPVTLEAGDSFYQPPGQWHVVSIGSEGAKTVVFRLVKKGQPMIVTVD